MDWNKTKTIFIIVFSILNVFLYSVYVNSYNEDKQVEVIGQTNVEEELKASHIEIGELPEKVKSTVYVSGKTKTFSAEDLKNVSSNQRFTYSHSGLVLTSKITIPYQLSKVDKYNLSLFVSGYAPQGNEYKLYKIDKKKHLAIFFQTAQERKIFYNESAYIRVKWNSKNQITQYEQTAFKNVNGFGEESTLVTANQAVKTLFKKGYLPEYSNVTTAELGYSTLVPLTETRVLSPTWRVHVKIPNGGKMVGEDLFINAVDGQYIDMTENKQAIEAE